MTTRLLTKTQAAAYCGLSPATFSVTCPVRPIALGEGVRMHRYDVQKIDAWIDGLQAGEQPKKKLVDELLDLMSSPSDLDERFVKVLRFMRDHPDCDTAQDIRGAGERTLDMLEEKGMIRGIGDSLKGKRRFVLTKAGRQELKNIEKWELELAAVQNR